MSAAELSELLLDPRLAIAAIVVRNGTVASSSDAARELFASEVGKPIEALFDAASRAKLAVAMTGIRLELVELEGHLDGATVSGDQVRLGQVVGNLIENAIRHSPARSAVTLELSATPDVVRLAVRDQGPGIPAKLRDRLFDRFVRGPGARGSLGLGLYVARQLVELHAGRIHIEDVAPHGASFVIELPRAH